MSEYTLYVRIRTLRQSTHITSEYSQDDCVPSKDGNVMQIEKALLEAICLRLLGGHFLTVHAVKGSEQ